MSAQVVVDGRYGVPARENHEQDRHASVHLPQDGKPDGVRSDEMWDGDHAQE
jgi:hypothetical protein